MEHYIQRPDELEYLCQADFATNYKYWKSRQNNVRKEKYEEREYEENSKQFLRTIQLKNNIGFIEEKVKPYVVQYRYNVNTHRSDCFQELVMLFKEVDIVQGSRYWGSRYLK